MAYSNLGSKDLKALDGEWLNEFNKESTIQTGQDLKFLKVN